MKKLALYSDCQYTRCGLEYIIESHPELSKRIKIIPYPEWGQILPEISILVLCRNINGSRLMQLGEKKFSGCKNVILITHLGKFTGVIRYLQDSMDVSTVLDINVTVETLQTLLLNILDSQGVPESYRYKPLSVREKEVFDALLRGKKTSQIATELQMNYKTVCSHKYTALAKLGSRSLEKLLLGF